MNRILDVTMSGVIGFLSGIAIKEEYYKSIPRKFMIKINIKRRRKYILDYFKLFYCGNTEDISKYVAGRFKCSPNKLKELKDWIEIELTLMELDGVLIEKDDYFAKSK